jgi:hypothetical protein
MTMMTIDEDDDWLRPEYDLTQLVPVPEDLSILNRADPDHVSLQSIVRWLAGTILALTVSLVAASVWVYFALVY